jgi:hypothetical protein
MRGERREIFQQAYDLKVWVDSDHNGYQKPAGYTAMGTEGMGLGGGLCTHCNPLPATM